MEQSVQLDRRAMMLRGGAALGTAFLCQSPGTAAQPLRRKGRIKQSLAFWCFNTSEEQWNLERTCRAAKTLSCKSVELVYGKQDHETVRKHGLTCALAQIDLAPDPPFLRGFNNPQPLRISSITSKSFVWRIISSFHSKRLLHTPRHCKCYNSKAQAALQDCDFITSTPQNYLSMLRISRPYSIPCRYHSHGILILDEDMVTRNYRMCISRCIRYLDTGINQL